MLLIKKKQNNNNWPLLLKNFNLLMIKTKFIICIQPKKLKKNVSFNSKIEKGVLNLDKPIGWNSFEISKWIKKNFKIKKTNCLGHINSNITGCLIVCLGSAAIFTNIKLKSQNDYVCVFNTKNFKNIENFNLNKVGKILKNIFFHSIFFFPVIKRQIRLKNIFSSFVTELNENRKLGILEISCEINLSIESLLYNLGFIFEKNLNVLEIRRIRFGNLTEEENLITLHDLLDARWLYDCIGNKFYFQKIIFPFEILLSNYKRIVVKDSTINSLCYGAKLLDTGILRIEKNIEKGEKIVLISSKGEIIGIGLSKINSESLFNLKKNIMAEIYHLLMEKDFYPKQWGLGIISTKKNIIVASGIQNHLKKKKFKNVKWWENTKKPLNKIVMIQNAN